MSETMDFKIGVDTKDAQVQLETLTGTLRRLERAFDSLNGQIVKGGLSASDKINVEGFGKLSYDKLAREIKKLRAEVSRAQEDLVKGSFKEGKKRFEDNTKFIETASRALSQIVDKQSKVYKDLEKLQAKSTKENEKIRKKWSGYGDFDSWSKEISDKYVQKDALSRAKSLQAEEKADRKRQELAQKERQRVKTLREEYRELRKVHEQLHADLLRGRATTRTKYQVGDQGAFTIKQLRERINLTKALMDIEEQSIRQSSFAKAKSDYANNLKAIVEGKKLLRQIKDRSSEAAKKLSADVANATRRNTSIEKRWGGYDDFAEYKQSVLTDLRKRTTLGDAKRQAVEEQRNHSQELKKKAERESEFIRTLKARYKEYYNERIALEEKLKKAKDKNSPEYTNGKARLDTLNREIKNIEYAGWGSKSFQDFHKSVNEKHSNKAILEGLGTQIKSEAKDFLPLSQRISDVKTKMGQLAYAYQKGSLKQEYYANGMRNLRKEYSLLKKAMDRVNDVAGRNNFSVFGANIRSHLHWLVSGALVDKLIELPMAIRDVTVEFDNLERKITQNIEMTERFANNHEALRQAAKGLVQSSFDLANLYGMKAEEVLNMMQIMSRRFKDPEELTYFTNLAAIMSKLDFVDPAVAAETLESVILSFGLTAKQTADFVDQFSVATHTMRINGQDLLEALQRSAPMLKSWGMSTAEAVSVISTLSTTLGREGTYIGTALNGMFSRPLKEQNIKALEEVGIAYTKANGEAKTGIELLREYHARFETLNENAQKIEVNKIFGTNRFAPAMSVLQNWKLIEQTLDKINSKASRANTFQLLKVQMGSLESQTNRTFNALKEIAYALGEQMIPPITALAERVARLTSGLARLDSDLLGVLVNFLKWLVYLPVAYKGLNKINIAMSKTSKLFVESGRNASGFAGRIDVARASLTRLGASLARVGVQFAKATVAAYALMTIMSAISSYVTDAQDDSAIDNHANKIGIDGLSDKNSMFGSAYTEYKATAYEIERDKNKYAALSWKRDNGEGLADSESKFVSDYGEKLNGIAGKREDAILAMEIDKTNVNMRKFERLSGGVPSIEPSTYGTEDSFVGDDSGSEADKANKEAKEKARREKSILDALVSKYKTEAELSQKAYDSLMGDIGFDQEIFGANPKNMSQSLYAKANRQAELRSQIVSRNRFIEELRGKYNSKLGDYQYVPSANFKALEDEMAKTLGMTYESTGSYVKEMLAKVGASVTNADLAKQVQEFKDKNKFFTDFSKVKLGDTIYWSGSDDAENKDMNYAGIYMGGNAVQFAGANGVGAVSLSDVKGIQGYGSTGVGDLKAEDLESLGDDNPIANTLAEYLKKIDEFQKLNEEDREKIKEIGRELKRGYLISDDKRFEEQKNRLKTEEETALLDNTNRVNAYNNMVLTNKKLEYAQKNLAVLQEEYKKVVNERMDWAKRLADLESEATDNMTKEQLEAHEVAVNTAKRNLELAQDTEAEKLLAVKKTNDEIEQLEYQRTQKIREGLHSVVHDFLLEGKSWKDIWSQLWSDLADEALRALMGIENGGQSMLGAIAAKAFGLDKENPNGEIAPQIESVNTNTNAMERNTAAITNLTNTLGSGQGSQNGTQSVSSITQSVAEVVEDAAPKWADEMDSVSSEELARKEGKNKDAMQMLTALGVVGAALSMSGSRKMQKFGALLSIATPFIGRGKGKKLSHSGSIVGVTPMATRYYHNGGMVGTAVTPYLKSDEVNAVLQTGEEVVSRKDRRTSEIMSEQNKYMADAMERMSANSNTNVTFAIQAIDSKSVVQLLNENGDAIMNILRKQSAYGNGRV